VRRSADHLAVTGNSFLDSLSAPTRATLLPLLELRKLKKAQHVAEPNEPFSHVFFPIRSVISTVTLTEEGSAVEVGLAGHEGLSPLPIAFGSLTTRHSTVVQIPDSALCMSAEHFLLEFKADGALRDRCSRYAEYSFVAATQFAACNGVHPVEERYARWILMANDRVGTAEFSLTQEYSAQMLGVRRATVTTIAADLSKRGLISYQRGRVFVTDREGLEEAACECYAAVNEELQRLMGYGARQPDVRELTGTA
jgi:CRP-like cAMP-binding protein